jgi:serine/threonine protein kinase
MIGKGSFARVYLVEDKETQARFAVKAFSKEYLLS